MHATRTRVILARFSSIVFGVSLVAGCSSGTVTSLPVGSVAKRDLPATRQSSRPFGYALLADTQNNVIDVFTRTGKLANQITSGIIAPSGLSIDGQNNLWVANNQNVVMFAPGATSPTRTLADPNQLPADVNAASDGTVYVANFSSTGGSQYGPGSISAYAPGHTKPTRFLHDPKAQYDDSVTSDAAGNLFTTINDYTGVGYVDEFVGGKQSGFKRLKPAFSFALTIRMNKAGNLLVLDQIQQRITEFTESGAPTGIKLHTHGNWTAFAIDSNGTEVLGAEDSPDSFKGILSTFPRYDRLRRFHLPYMGLIQGVAFAPVTK
jgi:hypothetical protein